MPKIRVLSEKDVIKILSIFGFQIYSQKGSHVKLARYLSDGTKQTLTIPNHDELDKGTLKAIYRQASRYINETDLRTHFFY